MFGSGGGVAVDGDHVDGSWKNEMREEYLNFSVTLVTIHLTNGLFSNLTIRTILQHYKL